MFQSGIYLFQIEVQIKSDQAFDCLKNAGCSLTPLFHIIRRLYGNLPVVKVWSFQLIQFIIQPYPE